MSDLLIYLAIFAAGGVTAIWLFLWWLCAQWFGGRYW